MNYTLRGLYVRGVLIGENRSACLQFVDRKRRDVTLVNLSLHMNQIQVIVEYRNQDKLLLTEAYPYYDLDTMQRMRSSKEKSQTQDLVGEAWKDRLRGKGYSKLGDIRFLKRFARSPYIQKILSYANLPSNSLILEPGCGSGKFSLAMASLGYQVVVLDYVIDVLLGVRETEDELGRKWTGKTKGYCLGSLEKLPFAQNTFNCVLNEGVVEHWLNDEERLSVLKEMVRVTKIGGIVGVLVPNGVHPLMDAWETQLQGFISTPPMTHYSAEKLGHELARTGLEDIHTDGIYPWRSWFRLAPWHRLYLVGAVLDRWFPLSKALRQRWAINLIAIGRKL